jgi:hypothetical protein
MREVVEQGFLGPGDDGEKGEVEVVFAHDWAWERDAKEKGRFWPGKL